MKKYIFASCLAALAGLLSVPAAMPASAADEYRLTGYRGDIDTNGTVDSADVSLLAQYLTGNAPDPFAGERADLDGSGSLDARDLSLLLRVAGGGEEPEGIYEKITIPDPVPMEPPINALSPTLPCTGSPRVLMLAVNFPDCAFPEGTTEEYLHKISFGDEDTASPFYPLESVSAYYRRSSYGRLNIGGDVCLCNAQYSVDAYADDPNALLDELLASLDGEINYTRYDANADFTLDTVIVVLPDGAVGRDANGDSHEDWWPCSGWYYGEQRYDGVQPGNLCIGAWSLRDVAGFNSTWVHELGHAMGLPDYYKYENIDSSGSGGMNGYAGWEMMDDAMGDMCAFSKLMYGWYCENEVQQYTGGTQTFTLQSSQKAPGCIVIPRESGGGWYSEFFIIEYADDTGNNAKAFYEDYAYPMFSGGGIRILHCNAELWNGYWGLELKWNNYGQCYDTSNNGKRVLRLVGEAAGGGFFTAGSTVSYSTSGFAWYGDSGWQDVDTGLTIRVEQIENGQAVVTVTQ